MYRRYASLLFIVGVDRTENEMAVYELIHHFLVSMDRIFASVCELDIMLHVDMAHFILDEMILNGVIAETNRLSNIDTVNKYVLDER